MRSPKIPFHPAKSNETNILLGRLRSDARFYHHPKQPLETQYAANFICTRNGRHVTIEKSSSNGVNVIFGADALIPNFSYKRRNFPKYDPHAPNNAVNSNFKLQPGVAPEGYVGLTAGEAMKIIDHIASLPRP